MLYFAKFKLNKKNERKMREKTKKKKVKACSCRAIYGSLTYRLSRCIRKKPWDPRMMPRRIITRRDTCATWSSSCCSVNIFVLYRSLQAKKSSLAKFAVSKHRHRIDYLYELGKEYTIDRCWIIVLCITICMRQQETKIFFP